MNPLTRLNRLSARVPGLKAKVDLQAIRAGVNQVPALGTNRDIEVAIHSLIDTAVPIRKRGWWGRLTQRRPNTAASAQLLAFAAEMSVLAVRKNDPALLDRGLRALAAEGGSADIRDSLIVLAQLFHSAEKLGMDPAPLLQNIARHATSAEMEAAMLQFPSRPVDERALRAFGLREGIGPDGFRYERGS